MDVALRDASRKILSDGAAWDTKLGPEPEWDDDASLDLDSDSDSGSESESESESDSDTDPSSSSCTSRPARDDDPAGLHDDDRDPDDDSRGDTGDATAIHDGVYDPDDDTLQGRTTATTAEEWIHQAVFGTNTESTSGTDDYVCLEHAHAAAALHTKEWVRRDTAGRREEDPTLATAAGSFTDEELRECKAWLGDMCVGELDHGGAQLFIT